jgi:CheY-like chemotaxis protein
MQELSPTAQAGDEAPVSGRILIVDDDPVVAGMLGVSLAGAGYEVVEVNSGEAALGKLTELSSELLPDIVFLDIEMGMGIDGFETCRRLRAADATRDLPVIFLSGHDELDDRLRAYDAGGSDFIAKPFVPDEVLRKALVAIRHRRRQETVVAESRSTFDTTMAALTALGESGVTLKFSRGALGCSTLRALAALAIKSLSAFGIDCHVQLRTPSETLTLTARGPASPLEESVIDRSKEMGRIFSFGNRLIVNYDSISLLVTNMPTADDNLCGRIRDEVAVIAETADLAVANINLRIDAVRRADELRKLADFSRQAIEELRSSHRQLQGATRFEFETMADTIEGMYVHLGLTNRQEFTISDTVRGAVDKVLAMIEGSSDLDRSFASIVDALSKAGEYTIHQEEEAPLTVELW